MRAEHFRLAVFSTASIVALSIATPSAMGQMFDYEPSRARSNQTIMLVVAPTEISFNGVSERQGPGFDFSGPTFGIRYARSNFDLSLSYGSDGESDNRVLEASLLAWSGWLLNPGSSTRVYLPFAVHSGYRSIGADLRTQTAAALFNFTTLSVGTGLVLESALSQSINLQARATPFIGLALRSFEGFAGRTQLLDLSARVDLFELFGKYGLSLGYSYRWQKWDVDASDLAVQVSEDYFDYTSRANLLSVGLNW